MFNSHGICCCFLDRPQSGLRDLVKVGDLSGGDMYEHFLLVGHDGTGISDELDSEIESNHGFC